MNLKIKLEDINISETIDYTYDEGLFLPEKLIETLKYSNKPFTQDKICYETEEYVAYASLYIKRIPSLNNQTFEVKIDNIRRKQYFNEPLDDNDKKDFKKASKGINYVAEYMKYVKECDPDVDLSKVSFTEKWI